MTNRHVIPHAVTEPVTVNEFSSRIHSQTYSKCSRAHLCSYVPRYKFDWQRHHEATDVHDQGDDCYAFLRGEGTYSPHYCEKQTFSRQTWQVLQDLRSHTTLKQRRK